MSSFRKDIGCWWPDTMGRDVTRDYNDIARSLNSQDLAISLCGGRSLVVQAGGHVGLWPLRLAKHFKDVLTFEPHPELFDCLHRNVKDVANIHPIPYALGAVCGREWFQVENNPARSHFDRNADLEVPVWALDSIGLAQCDAMFLDVEGYEVSVLNGARDTIRRLRPIIQVEMLPRSQQAISDTLKGMGYKAVRKVGRDTVYRHAH